MDEEEYLEMSGHAQIAGQTQKNAAEAAQYYLEEKEKGIVDIQLEVDSIKSDIYHLLRQDRQFIDDETQKIEWKPLENNVERTLTDWGVERIMQVIHFYINKNTLLTNFDQKQINSVMLTFMNETNDLILLKYQNLFCEPTFEECKNIIQQRLENKKKMRMFTLEVLGQEIDEEKISNELLGEMEVTLAKEMEKIKNEKRKEKLRDYGLLVAQLEIIVYATLNRAFRGEERGSIRRHTQISELIGGRPPQQQTKGGMFSWGSR